MQSCKDRPYVNYRGFWLILLFTAQPSNQSPMSLTSDASSPRSYVSPRISTPQTNTVPIKPLISTPPVSSQPKVSSDKMWSTGEGNGKPLQYSCLENPINSMKRQKDMTLKNELPRLVGAQYTIGEGWRNNSRKNEETEPKQKQCPVVDDW